MKDLPSTITSTAAPSNRCIYRRYPASSNNQLHGLAPSERTVLLTEVVSQLSSVLSMLTPREPEMARPRWVLPPGGTNFL